MHGLDLINQLVDKEKKDAFMARYREEFPSGADIDSSAKKADKKVVFKEKKITYDYDVKDVLAPNYSTQKLTQSLTHLSYAYQ